LGAIASKILGIFINPLEFDLYHSSTIHVVELTGDMVNEALLQ